MDDKENIPTVTNEGAEANPEGVGTPSPEVPEGTPPQNEDPVQQNVETDPHITMENWANRLADPPVETNKPPETTSNPEQESGVSDGEGPGDGSSNAETGPVGSADSGDAAHPEDQPENTPGTTEGEGDDSDERGVGAVEGDAAKADEVAEAQPDAEGGGDGNKSQETPTLDPDNWKDREDALREEHNRRVGNVEKYDPHTVIEDDRRQKKTTEDGDNEADLDQRGVDTGEMHGPSFEELNGENGDASPTENKSRSGLTSEQMSRLQELQQKRDKGEQFNKEERREFNSLRYEQKNAEEKLGRLDTLRERANGNGEPLSEEEMSELESLEEEGVAPDVESKTPEEEKEEIQKQLENMREAAIEKFANGDFENAGEDIIAYNKLLAESQGFDFSGEQEKVARKFLEGVLKPENAGSPRETAKMRNIREKLQDLAKMEMQLRGLAETVKKMEEQENHLKGEVDEAEREYVNERNPDEKQKKLMAFSGKAMQLARYQDAIKLQKQTGRNIWSQQRQARGYIHRKLGTKNAMYNLVFGAGTAVGQGAIAMANSYDAIFDVS